MAAHAEEKIRARDVFATIGLFGFVIAVVAVPVTYNIVTAPTEKELLCQSIGVEGEACDKAWDNRST